MVQVGAGRGVVLSITNAEDRLDIATPAQEPTSIAGPPFTVDCPDEQPATLVVEANSVRTQVIIRNTDAANDVVLGYSEDIDMDDAAVLAPILLAAGQHWVESVWQGAMYARGSGGTVTVAVEEVGQF